MRGRSLVAHVVRLDNQVNPDRITRQFPYAASAYTRGFVEKPPFGTHEAELTTTADVRDSAVTPLRAHQKRASGRHRQQTVARLRRQPS